MPEITGLERLFSLIAKKRFGKYNQYGTSQYGFSYYGDEDVYFAPPGREPILLSGIYRTDNVKGYLTHYREPYYFPSNPRTPSQQANRQKFANAVHAWQSLTEEQKKVYNERAKGKNLSGYNLFISEYMRTS